MGYGLATRHGEADGRIFGIRRISTLVRLLLPALPVAGALLFTAIVLLPISKESPAILRVGVLPDQSPKILEQRYKPLLAYLSAEIGKPVQLVMPSDYAALLELFRTREIDIAYFGGLTFLKARETAGARALVMRDVDARLRSVFLARSDRPETTIADFRGKTLAFGSRLSTSGHLMPRHFLRLQDIDPESWFAGIIHAGTHDATAMLVRDGDVDLGVANAEIVQAMFRDGRLRRDEMRVIEQTPPYVDYVWAMRVGFDTDLYEQVIFAFLKLSPADDKDAEILKKLGAGGFLPVRDSQFGSLHDIARSLGMLG